ncbi:MAG: hypothetical protein J0L92_05535 [Deltaproteobacteria bacterium]|nr:hypothetical protein [Deltaproteobacteria bacterium]
MLRLQPAVARYTHEAHAITRAALEALEAAGARVLEEAYREASALLSRVPSRSARDSTTPLDVVAATACRARALEALRGTSHAAAIADLEALSLDPRDVSAWAETVFVRRTMRLQRLLQLEAPEPIVESELELLRQAMRRLDTLVPNERDEEDRFLPDEEIVRFSDPRFDLSLGSWTAVLDAVADFHRESRPADGSEVLALGGPLLAIDFASPPPALLERAFRERGVYDADEERALAYGAPWGPWLEWSVLDGAEGLEDLRDTLRALRGDLRDVPAAFRDELVSSIECDHAPFVTCDDWIPALEARLTQLEHDVGAASEAGLVVLSAVRRDLSY